MNLANLIVRLLVILWPLGTLQSTRQRRRAKYELSLYSIVSLSDSARVAFDENIQYRYFKLQQMKSTHSLVFRLFIAWLCCSECAIWQNVVMRAFNLCAQMRKIIQIIHNSTIHSPSIIYSMLIKQSHAHHQLAVTEQTGD